MLNIYGVMLGLAKSLVPSLEQIGRHDGDLERQLRRATTSVVLNIAEGSSAKGKSRSLFYSRAVGSARECVSILQVSLALGYVGSIDATVLDRFDHVIATMVKVTRNG